MTTLVITKSTLVNNIEVLNKKLVISMLSPPVTSKNVRDENFQRSKRTLLTLPTTNNQQHQITKKIESNQLRKIEILSCKE